MTEAFILPFISIRMKQLGYLNYHIRYHDYQLEAGTQQVFPAFNEVWFIVGDPTGVTIESDYGKYDGTGKEVTENMHQHRGEIIVSNPDTVSRKIKFIRTIIVN